MDSGAKGFLFHKGTAPLVASVAPTIEHGQVDWVETTGAHIFKVNVPGLRKESIQIQVVEEEILQIAAGEHKRERVEGKWHSLERPRGSFFRQFRLPGPVLVDEIRGYDEYGVVTIVVPKKSSLKMIDIKWSP
eukprot:c21557_g1_i2 orf=209-607(-)